MELPLNVIVVVILAALVLVVVAAFFTVNIAGGIRSIGEQEALSTGCTNLLALYGCESANVNKVTIEGFRQPGDQNVLYSLGNICALRGIATAGQCAKTCGCPGDDAGSGEALSKTPQTVVK